MCGCPEMDRCALNEHHFLAVSVPGIVPRSATWADQGIMGTGDYQDFFSPADLKWYDLLPCVLTLFLWLSCTGRVWQDGKV